MPKISVIIPVYGVEKYIEKCARSLFEQTLEDIEYLFINDCTLDRSIDILLKVLAEYPNRKSQVRIYHMDKNSGQAIVRIKGLELATGDFIIHCDSDDWVSSDIYEKLYRNAIDNKSDIVFCDYYKAMDDDHFIEVHKTIRNCNKKTLMKMAFVGHELNTLWNALICKELYKNVTHPKGPQGEDKTYMIQLIWKAQKCSYLPESLYYYRDNPTSITNNNTVEFIIKKHYQFIDNQKIILTFVKEQKLDCNYHKEIEAYKLYGKLGLYSNLKDQRCRKIWDDTYPEIKYRILFNRCINLKIKILYILSLLRLYK